MTDSSIYGACKFRDKIMTPAKCESIGKDEKENINSYDLNWNSFVFICHKSSPYEYNRFKMIIQIFYICMQSHAACCCCLPLEADIYV